jgi:hypothetical protein
MDESIEMNSDVPGFNCDLPYISKFWSNQDNVYCQTRQLDGRVMLHLLSFLRSPVVSFVLTLLSLAVYRLVVGSLGTG